MAVLHHYPLSPSSRFIRLQCGEYGLDISLRTQIPWLRDEEFLTLNPAGDVPVLEDENLGVVCGARVISEWLEEGDDTLGDTGLLSTLVNINCLGIEEKNLGIGELLFLWLFRFWLESWVDRKD